MPATAQCNDHGLKGEEQFFLPVHDNFLPQVWEGMEQHFYHKHPAGQENLCGLARTDGCPCLTRLESGIASTAVVRRAVQAFWIYDLRACRAAWSESRFFDKISTHRYRGSLSSEFGPRRCAYGAGCGITERSGTATCRPSRGPRRSLSTDCADVRRLAQVLFREISEIGVTCGWFPTFAGS